jgi:hypothetical protein
MMTFDGERLCVVCSAVLVICALHAHGQEKRLPTLGSRVPSWVLNARAHSETCLTDVGHRDPCTTVTIKRTLLKVAWDRETSTVTFLFYSRSPSDHGQRTGSGRRMQSSR